MCSFRRRRRHDENENHTMDCATRSGLIQRGGAKSQQRKPLSHIGYLAIHTTKSRWEIPNQPHRKLHPTFCILDLLQNRAIFEFVELQSTFKRITQAYMPAWKLGTQSSLIVSGISSSRAFLSRKFRRMHQDAIYQLQICRP